MEIQEIKTAKNVDEMSQTFKSNIKGLSQKKKNQLLKKISSVDLEEDLDNFLNNLFKGYMSNILQVMVVDDDWKINYMKALLEKLQTYTNNDISSLRLVLVQVIFMLDDFMKWKMTKKENDLLAIRLCENSLSQISACLVKDYDDPQEYADYWIYYFNILLRHLLTLYERNGFSLAMITIYQMLITTLKHQKSKKDRKEESTLKNSIEQGLAKIPQNQLLDKLMSHRGIRQRTLRKEYDSRINHIKYLTDLQKLIRDATLPDGKLPDLDLKNFKDRLEDASHSFPVIKFGKYSIMHESDGFYPEFHIPTSKKLDDLYEEYQKEQQLRQAQSIPKKQTKQQTTATVATEYKILSTI